MTAGPMAFSSLPYSATLLPLQHSEEPAMTRFTDAFIRDIPKTDLHVHLDGSLRPGDNLYTDNA